MTAEARAARQMALQIEALERRLKALERTPSLARSAVHDGAISVYSEADLTMLMGQQYDGTVVAASVGGPTPPRPSQPTLTATPQGITVAWDGQYGDDTTGETRSDLVAPMDWARVDVVVAASPEADFIATPPVAAITSPRGGTAYAALDPGTYYVALVTRTASGKASAISLVADAIVVTPEDPEPGQPAGGSFISAQRITENAVIPPNTALGDPAGYVAALRQTVVGEGASIVVTLYIPSLTHTDPEVYVYAALNGTMIQLAVSNLTPDDAPGNTVHLVVTTGILEVDAQYVIDVGFRTALGNSGLMLCAETYPTTVLTQRL